jgi:hypothetical protein
MSFHMARSTQIAARMFEIYSTPDPDSSDPVFAKLVQIRNGNETYDRQRTSTESVNNPSK